MDKIVWFISGYGTIEGENWREYRFNQFAKYLSNNGYKIIWWTSNFSHHFKKFRSESWKDIKVNENYTIRLVPTSAYKKNFSFGRFKKDFNFAKNVYRQAKHEILPSLVIADCNPMLGGYPAYQIAKSNHIPIIYDQMDIWPEFIVKVLKFPLNIVANVMFTPVYIKRKINYGHIDGAIALGKHYLEYMYQINPKIKKIPNSLIYNGIDVQSFRMHLEEKTTINKLNFCKEENEIWCIFAGTLGPSYDIPGIIKCAQLCYQKNTYQYKFIIAGSGPLESDVIAAEKNLPNLIYVGKLLPEQLIPIYGKCDIGLCTYAAGSNVDMCDKFYDYTAAGLAIINSLTGEICEHIEEQRIGVNYHSNLENGLFDALSEIESAGELNKMKRNSWNAGYEFDKNSQNKKLLEIVKIVLGEK